MKKVLASFIALTLLLNTGLTFAGSEICPITEGTPELLKYIREFREQTEITIREIVKNPEYNPDLAKKQKEDIKNTPWLDNFIFESAMPVTNEAEKIGSKTKNYFYGRGQKVMDLAKEIARVKPSWDSYILSGAFWIGAIMYDYSLPIAIKRDFNLVRMETERINTYIDNLVDSGININPKFENSYIVGLPGLLELNKRLEFALMGAIAKGYSSEKGELKVANEAITQLNTYINENNLNFNTDFLSVYTEIIKGEQCRQGTGPIDQIIEVWENGFDGIFEPWEEAYDLLMGTTGLGTKEQEAKARKKGDILLKDLYGNNEGEDKDNDILFENLKKDLTLDRLNPISNSSKQQWDNLKKYLDKFKDSVKKIGSDMDPDRDEDLMNIKNIKEMQGIEFDKIDATIRVRNMYEELKYVIPSTSKEQNDLKNKVLQSHSTIEEAINYLDKATPVAEKVCNSQGVGLGKCKATDYTK